MWKVKGTHIVWESAKHKTAERPHWITIIIGILSPSIAVAALYISLRSLETAELNMQVGQRAYVHIMQGEFSIETNENVNESSREAPNTAAMYSFEINNLGNTPAEIVSISVEIDSPIGWHRTEPIARREPRLSSIHAKGARRHYDLKEYHLEPDQLRDFLPNRMLIDANPKLQPVLRGHVIYRDIFKATHEVKWCWIAVAQEPYPDDCPSK